MPQHKLDNKSWYRNQWKGRKHPQGRNRGFMQVMEDGKSSAPREGAKISKKA